MTTKTMEMRTLAVVLDSESYEWLAAHHPDILAAIESEVAAGRTADEIRLFTLMRTGRVELAMRCQQCARHVERVRNE